MVARVAYGLGDVVVAVRDHAVGLVVNPAVGRVALVGVLAEDALAVNARLGVDDVLS